MKKYIYMLKSFKNSTMKTFFKLKKIIKNKTNKKFVGFDMIYCAIKHQAAFYDYLEFEFYTLSNKQRKTYLTSGKNNQIVKKFNDKDARKVLDNKEQFNKRFNKYINREYLNHNSSKNEFKKFIENKESVIIKPMLGIGGKGIKILKTNDKQLFNLSRTNMLEEIIVQHSDLNKIYNKSVNTLRIFTFNDENVVHIMQTIIKFGNNSVVDNFSSGGMYAFVNEEGIIITPAIDQNDKVYTSHPITKETILGATIPLFDKAISFVISAAKEIEKVKYIGWDIAIKEKGIAIIEANSYPGIFQIKPQFDKKKEGLVPKYEKIMNIKF